VERQRFYEAGDGAGGTERFYFAPAPLVELCRREGYSCAPPAEEALAAAMEYAQSAGGFGAVVLMERRRLNDYVGSPVWSEPTVIEEV
jgi:hypothetical protein